MLLSSNKDSCRHQLGDMAASHETLGIGVFFPHQSLFFFKGIMYQNLRKGLNSKALLIPVGDVPKELIKEDVDYYTSLFQYTNEHKKYLEDKGSLAGIRDTVTNRVYFDFDCRLDLDLARIHAVELAKQLIDRGVPMDNIQATFSGKKGYSIEFFITDKINVDQYKAILNSFVYSTLDKGIADNNRIIRLVNTKHIDTGLYKIPLYLYELEELTSEEIKIMAKSPRYDFVSNCQNTDLSKTALVKTLEVKKEFPKIIVKLDDGDLDYSKKPSFLSNCRWALQNGFFKEGIRNQAFISLASTYKNLGFDIEHVYRLLKGVAEIQSRRNGEDRYADKELYNNVVKSVFSDTWQGGQYTCKKPGWLQDYCVSLGNHACVHKQENALIDTGEIFNLYQDYVADFDKNILTTGIASLDEQVNLMVGTSNALVASPGAGKTTCALQILNHNSNKGVNCLFFSYDMFHSALITRMIQRHTKMNTRKTYEMFRNEEEKANLVKGIIAEQYKNVKFCFKGGQTCEDINEAIIEAERSSGQKIKLVVIDYNELIVSSHSEPTAASAEIAQKLRQIANERQVCMFTLLQPSKMYSTPSEEITNYNAAKGSSSIVQSLTLMLSACRPGFDPMNPSHDKYFNITVLKNRNGGVFSTDLKWEGLSGTIGELEDFEREELNQLRMRKKAKGDNGWD